MPLGKLLRFRIRRKTRKPSTLTCHLKDDVAQKAVDDMNTFIDGAKINFQLQNVSRIDNARCTGGLENKRAMDALKAEVHQGNTSTLNLVYVPTNQGPGVKGVCVLPQPGTNIASNIGSQDGCVIAIDTLPDDNGGDPTNGGRGKPGGNNGRRSPEDTTGSSITTTHEMGHWLSLPHVNEGGQIPSVAPIKRSSSGRFRRQIGGGSGNVMEPVSKYALPHPPLEC